MSSDPRNSDDSLVQTALALWDHTKSYRDEAYTKAWEIREELRFSNRHQAYGWVTATCGRIAAYRNQFDLSEALLTEAFGRFFLIDDVYGKALVSSHMALPQALRGNLGRALDLALEPFHSGVAFASQDLSLMHSIAAMCYAEREEFSAAIFHLTNEYEIVKKSGDMDRAPITTANIGVLLMRIGEFELALAVFSETWKLEQARCTDPRQIDLAFLSNLIDVNCHLDRVKEAAAQAELLMTYLLSRNHAEISSVVFDSLADVLARSGRIELAKNFLNTARAMPGGRLSLAHEKQLACTDALLLEMTGHPDRAIVAVRELLADSTVPLPCHSRRAACATLSRCYAKLGDRKNSELWATYRNEVGRGNILSEMLLSQIRANFRVEEPAVDLTEQELNCLRLSASGQTSSDIGLKLGIKPRTVNFHFSKILRKLNAMNRQEAIAKVVSANLIR